MTKTRKAALLLGAAALIGMGGVTVACSPAGEKHEAPEPGITTSVTTPAVSSTEKAVRTNVTRAPMSAAPQAGTGGNAAVPCGFGPSGGLYCGN